MTQSAHTHIHDAEGHVHAVESDLEYFRTKRLEPRVLHFLRRGIVRFVDLLDADVGPLPTADAPASIEGRIRHVEDELDRLVRAIAVATVRGEDHAVAIEDNRRERGDYDDFLRLAKRSHGEGSVADRLDVLDAELAEAHRLIASFVAALLTRGAVASDVLERRREDLDRIGHHNGARIVARAWTDPGFKQRLLDTGRAAVRELDIPPGRLGLLGVAENTADEHHIVVCTLCSCYPHDLLGNPPWWYRTDEYKQRIVAEPKATIIEMFGLALPEATRVSVHDSTSDVRWMVLPRRPEGTEHFDEQQLAALVTPESLVGAGLALAPGDTSTPVDDEA